MSGIRDKISIVLLSPLVMAIPFALITILLYPFTLRQSNLVPSSVSYAEHLGGNRVYFYHDLDNDGIDECIVHFQNEIDQCAMMIFSGTGETWGQWNFNGFLNKSSHNLTFSDCTGDGVLDVFTLYQRNDSVFLGGIDPLDDTRKIVDDLFLDVIRKVNNRFHYDSQLYTSDLNNDGSSEVVAVINAGYSKQPRRIYAYNFADSTLLKTQPAGFAIVGLSFVDLDNDGYQEIIPITSALENISPGDSVPYHDDQQWFVIYNHLLEFAIEPVNLGAGNGKVFNFHYRQDSTKNILLIGQNHERVPVNKSYTYNMTTRVLSPLEINFPDDALFFECMIPYQHFMGSYSSSDGDIVFYDPAENMKVMKKYSIDKNLFYLQNLSITNEVIPDFVFYKKTPAGNVLHIYTQQFDHSYKFAITNADFEINNLTTFNARDGSKRLMIQVGQSIYEFEHIFEKYFLLKAILIIAAIYVFYVLMICLIIRGQKKIIKAHYLREKTLAELKLKSIRNQMDPHFTFNAVNAIAAAIYREDREEAYTYFSKFSKLIRSTMLYSDRISRTLDEELDFTQKYLEIEKFRYREKFEFSIKVHPGVNLSIEVPRMIIETFAESAINNGLVHRERGGLLHIEIFQDGKILKAIFEDNGVGMIRAAEYNKEKAFRAANLMEEFLKVYNELNKTRIVFEMCDLDIKQEFPGTRVVVKMPVASRYLRLMDHK